MLLLPLWLAVCCLFVWRAFVNGKFATSSSTPSASSSFHRRLSAPVAAMLPHWLTICMYIGLYVCVNWIMGSKTIWVGKQSSVRRKQATRGHWRTLCCFLFILNFYYSALLTLLCVCVCACVFANNWHIIQFISFCIFSHFILFLFSYFSLLFVASWLLAVLTFYGHKMKGGRYTALHAYIHIHK